MSNEMLAFLGAVIVGLLAALAGALGHWMGRKNAKDQNKIQLVAELNDTELEKKKLDFEVLKTTVEALRSEVDRLTDKVKKLDLVTSKYWRLVNVVRAWVTRYHISEDEIPHDIREDL
ncbi:hypothetical protein [Glutamicibacter sp. TV12E]|uniref:hypothetical protein n=1 Tax=Glutamicibacter sp. TV12E TaxID=3446362 RepID=UPI004033D717